MNSFKRLITTINSISGRIAHGSSLTQNESVIFFPSCANKMADGSWCIPVRAWVFEAHHDRLLQKLSSHTNAKSLESFEVTEQQAHSPLFQERIKWFLVDNERNKKIKLSISGKSVIMPRSSVDGHARLSVNLDSNDLKDWQTFHSIVSENNSRTFKTDIEFIPDRGLSVISDIDDTIKISNVTNKLDLLQSVLFKEYEPIPGMPRAYQQLLNKGASFHYISASPWALYPSLKPFMDSHYPQGSMLLRHFRATEQNFFKFFQSSQQYKTDAIRYLIRRFPNRNFILIGDSGEKDPAIYAQTYHEFPNSISKILIRCAPTSKAHRELVETVFENIPADKWMLFDNPEMIQI